MKGPTWVADVLNPRPVLACTAGTEEIVGDGVTLAQV